MDVTRSILRVGRHAELGTLRAIGRVAPWTTTTSVPDAPPRVLVYVPSYPPLRSGGAEVSMAAIAREFEQRGHQVQVLLSERAETDLGDLSVTRSAPALVRAFASADVVFTQLEARNRAIRLGALTRRPVVHFLRMGNVDAENALGIPELVVFNASWLRDDSGWPGPTEVLHPPVVTNRYRTTPGTAYTLVNLNRAKGAELFYELARRLPEQPFLGVRGTWGEQFVPDPLPSNVTVLGPVRNMREVYARTKVLLMPSRWESYGRVGLEAAASGIPTVASDVPGIREALGTSARYAPRDQPDAWIDQLRALEDPAVHEHHRDLALIRSSEVERQTTEELDRLEGRVLELVCSRRPVDEAS